MEPCKTCTRKEGIYAVEVRGKVAYWLCELDYWRYLDTKRKMAEGKKEHRL